MRPIILGDFVSSEEVQEIFNLHADCEIVLAVKSGNCVAGNTKGFVFVLYRYAGKLWQIADDYCDHKGIAYLPQIANAQVSTDSLRQALQNPKFIAYNDDQPFADQLNTLLNELDQPKNIVMVVGDSAEPEIQFIIKSPSQVKNAIVAELINRSLLFAHGLMTETALTLSVDKFRTAFPKYYEKLTA